MPPTPSSRCPPPRARLLSAAAAALACLVLAGCVGTDRGTGTQPGSLTAAARSLSPAGGPPASGSPNIVFVLTDDLSLNLLQFMPHVLAMERDGLTFANYFVSDSLCCPSRSSIFTGNFPHDTAVFGNFGPYGGFRTFHARGEERQTFAVALQQAGYLTALMGKYLNGYLESPAEATDGATTNVPPTYVPPGWSEWDVGGWGYPEFNYRLNENGTLQRFGRNPADYLTDVLARRGVSFIDSALRQHKPFLLELATFAPHAPYVPAPRNAADFPGLQVPRPPSFDVLPTHAPQWLAVHPRLTAAQIFRLDKVFRRRAQSVEAVDAMIGQIEAKLAADGLAQNTYLVLSSDNGLHTGEYRLMPGKLTAFDTDIHVPLIVTGPGVPAGRTTDLMAENIDLAETFADIAGEGLSADGRSLMPMLHGQSPANWRDAILVEHRGPVLSVLDPDYQQPTSGSPTTYEAMRTPTFLYVEYADGEREFYDLKADPFELHNIAERLAQRRLALLHAELQAMTGCHGAEACWHAMHVEP